MKPVIIAGPCVIESAALLDTVATELVRLNSKYGLTSFSRLPLTRQTVLRSIHSEVPAWKRDSVCLQT